MKGGRKMEETYHIDKDGYLIISQEVIGQFSTVVLTPDEIKALLRVILKL
jgi:hypothetical protein